MGQVIRCPLTGVPCNKPIEIQRNAFFLAEAEKPDGDRERRITALKLAFGDKYQIRSALDEKGINAFTCKICEMIQACGYGIADISQNNANVFVELGMMIALGKPSLILAKKEQETGLRLPSDLIAIEVIPFTEYIDIIGKLKEIMQKLPLPVIPSTPIEDLEKLRPQLASEISRLGTEIAREFKKNIQEARLDTISRVEEKKEIPPELSERLCKLEQRLVELTELGLIADVDTALMRGNYYYNQKKYGAALASYNWVLQLKPDNPKILNMRGITYIRLERYEEALADLNHSLELRPDDPETLNNRGVTYGELEKYEEALADLNRSLELRPDDPGTLSNRGLAYKELERYEEALADLNRSLELRPDDPETLNNRGITYEKLERYEEALADLNRSLELRPDDPKTLNNRGVTYGKLERYKEELGDLNRSLELRPYDFTLYNLACIFSLKKEVDTALVYLQKAIDKSSKLRQKAKKDKDFDNIKNSPSFKKLIEGE